MKSFSLTSVAFGLLFAQAQAAPAEAGSKCSANNCLRAVRAGSFPNRPTAADCSSYLLATVTPATHTETVWATVTPVTETATTTGTSVVTELETKTDRETVDATTLTITTTVQGVPAPTPKKRSNDPLAAVDVLQERQVTVTPSAQPAYASSCSTAGAYASACSCIGIFPSTTTVAVPTTVVTSTVTATALTTVGIVTVVTETVTETTTETESRTVTNQATATAVSTGYNLQLLSDDASVDGKLLRDVTYVSYGDDVHYLTIDDSGAASPVYTIDPATSALVAPGGQSLYVVTDTQYTPRYTFFFSASFAPTIDWYSREVLAMTKVGDHLELTGSNIPEWGYCHYGGGEDWLSVKGDTAWDAYCKPVRVVFVPAY